MRARPPVLQRRTRTGVAGLLSRRESRKSVRHNAVRPLSQTSAMLIPCGLALHASIATDAPLADRPTRRDNLHKAIAQPRNSARFDHPYARGARPWSAKSAAKLNETSGR